MRAKYNISWPNKNISKMVICVNRRHLDNLIIELIEKESNTVLNSEQIGTFCEKHDIEVISLGHI